MSKFSITTALARSEEIPRQGARRVKHIIKKPPIPALNDDVLLHIFYIHRLHTIQVEDKGIGNPCWDSQRWWYKLAHVSRRWRRVILAAPSLLDLHLVCASGVPVADILAHSPPLPLTIFYWLDGYMAMKEEDKEGALLALSHRDRVRRIALHMETWELEKLFVAMDGEFPILERLNIIVSSTPNGLRVTLPQTFGAPNLSHVILMSAALPIKCPLLTTTGLVSLRLEYAPRSTSFPPSYILASLSLMPQLETLWIKFNYPARCLRDTATTFHVTLHHLREFEFRGFRIYLEDLCAQMTAPVLSAFHVHFYSILHPFTAPHLLSFMQTPERSSCRFHAIQLTCSCYSIHLQGDAQPSGLDAFSLKVPSHHLRLQRQVSTAICILDALFPVLSVAEQLTLVVTSDRQSLPNNDVDRTQWRGLLRPLSNVKVLRVVTDVGDYGLGHSLRTEDGEQPLDLLPNLEEVSYSGSDDENAFTRFINERVAVGHPVRLTMQNLRS